MDSLIEELNDPLECPETTSIFALCREAADHIEQLEAKIERLSSRGIEDMQDTIRQQAATIERIRKVSEDSALSWQDKHIATWKIVKEQE